MIYYLILAMFAIIQFAILLNYSKNRSLQTFIYIICSALLFLLAGLRRNIGYDFSSYEYIFNQIHTGSYSALYYSKTLNYEIAFVILAKLCRNFSQLIFVSAFLGVVVKCIVISKYSQSKFLCLILYFSGVFLNFDMGVIRQGISISFILISLIYIRDRKFLKFIVVVALGALFHISTLVVIPLYFLSKKKIPYQIMYCGAFLALLVSLIDLRYFVIQFFRILPFDIATSKVLFYANQSSSTLTLSLIKRILFLFIFVEFYRRKKISYDWAVISLNGYFLSILLMGFFSSIDIVGGRGTMGLYFLQIFIFDTLIRHCKHVYSRLLVLIITVFLSFNSMKAIIDYGNQSNQPYSPYQIIFIE